MSGWGKISIVGGHRIFSVFGARGIGQLGAEVYWCTCPCSPSCGHWHQLLAELPRAVGLGESPSLVQLHNLDLGITTQSNLTILPSRCVLKNFSCCRPAKVSRIRSPFLRSLRTYDLTSRECRFVLARCLLRLPLLLPPTNLLFSLERLHQLARRSCPERRMMSGDSLSQAVSSTLARVYEHSDDSMLYFDPNTSTLPASEFVVQVMRSCLSLRSSFQSFFHGTCIFPMRTMLYHLIMSNTNLAINPVVLVS